MKIDKIKLKEIKWEILINTFGGCAKTWLSLGSSIGQKLTSLLWVKIFQRNSDGF